MTSGNGRNSNSSKAQFSIYHVMNVGRAIKFCRQQKSLDIDTRPRCEGGVIPILYFPS